MNYQIWIEKLRIFKVKTFKKFIGNNYSLKVIEKLIKSKRHRKGKAEYEPTGETMYHLGLF